MKPITSGFCALAAPRQAEGRRARAAPPSRRTTADCEFVDHCCSLRDLLPGRVAALKAVSKRCASGNLMAESAGNRAIHPAPDCMQLSSDCILFEHAQRLCTLASHIVCKDHHVAQNNPTLTEKLATAIADGILDGTLQARRRASTRSAWPQQHGVSRTPVREALRQLAMSGLIDMRPRKGAVVSKATPEQVESLFVAMAEMEATCARLCAPQHDAGRTAAAAGAARSDDRAGRARRSRRLFGRQRRLPFGDLCRRAQRAARRVRDGPAPPGRPVPPRPVPGSRAACSRSNQEHDAVVRAILSGDAAGAHAAMLHHVSLVEDAFETFAATNAGVARLHRVVSHALPDRRGARSASSDESSWPASRYND